MSNSSTKVLAKRGKNWVQVTTDPDGKKTEQEVAPTPTAIERYKRLAAQRAPQQPSEGRPKPIADIRGSDAGDRFEREKKRLEKVGNKPETAAQIDARVSALNAKKEPPAAASGPVLSKRKGIEGTGVGADFKARAFSAAEKSRYSSVAAQNAARSSAASGAPKPSPTTPAASAPKPAIGVLGKTSFERRTPTSAELSGAQGAPAGSTPEQRLQAAQKKTFGPPTTGPAPTQAQMSDAGAVSKAAASKVKKESYDAYDLVLEYLFSQGHVETIAEAHYVMMEMDAEMIGDIVESPGEWFGGIRDKARASRDSQMQSLRPTPKPLPTTSSPFQKPGSSAGNVENRASRSDGGKLTTYGAGGGRAAEAGGMSYDKVVKQGASNIENKKRVQPKNQGPDFGR